MTEPTITTSVLAEAEKLAAVAYTEAERELVLLLVEQQLDRVRQFRGTDLPNHLGPAPTFDPRLPGRRYTVESRTVQYSRPGEHPLPTDAEDIAFASISELGGWLRSGAITSVGLTEIYLERLARIGSRLECVVNPTESLAMAQSARADAELAAGRDRGPLHGIPWAAKDLLDTAGIHTTWGATPYKSRVAVDDAFVVQMLEQAGAVLAAKTTLGALAYGDVWFDGRTRNPWNLEEGASGSSAGSAAAVAAGLVGFAIGSETMGSIVSPCMRCGSTGLRPTFGRVSRSGAMALAWSLDKIGPIARRVEDTMMVLAALNGHDAGDPGSIDIPLNFDATAGIDGLRVGLDPRWFDDAAATPLDRQVLDTVKNLGLRTVEVRLPELPYDALWTILAVEPAAAFEELTLSDRDDLLVRQDKDAWPNRFRTARFISAVDFVQAQRLRRRVMEEMAAIYDDIDVLIGPSFASPMQLVTNMTGQPSLTLRAGFLDVPSRTAITAIGALPQPDSADGEKHRVPYGVTLWGRLFDEGTLCRIGMALEAALGVWHARPDLDA